MAVMIEELSEQNTINGGLIKAVSTDGDSHVGIFIMGDGNCSLITWSEGGVVGGVFAGGFNNDMEPTVLIPLLVNLLEPVMATLDDAGQTRKITLQYYPNEIKYEIDSDKTSNELGNPTVDGTDVSLVLPDTEGEFKLVLKAIQVVEKDIDFELEKLSDLLEQGIETENLIVDVTTIDQNINSAEISEEDFAFMAELVREERNRLVGLTVKLDSGELNLDQTTVSLIHELGGIVIVSISDVETWKLTEEQKSLAANRLVIDITIKAGEYLVGDLAGGQIRVKIPYELKPNENPDYIVIWHLNSQGELEAYYCIYEDGYVFFTLDHLSQYIVSYLPFKDVEMNKWYYGDVAYVYQNKLMEGIGNELFAPEAITNRAMLVSILYRLEGSPAVAASEDFADVAKTAWYYEGVMWAKEKGITAGIGKNLFDPKGTLTREQLATLLYRYDNYKGQEHSYIENHGQNFVDWPEVSTWAEEAMVWSIDCKMLQGIGANRLDPKGQALRSQMAAILQRYLTS